MELKKFVNLIAVQFDETPKDVFDADTHFRELDEWDSLVALSVIAELDEEMGKKITGADIRNCTTIEDLFTIAISK